MRQPDGFSRDDAQRWSRWVLAHGLPPLPGTDLALDESVPVAFWIGETTAAVLHLRRYCDDEDEDPEVLTETDIDLFLLVDGEWESCGGGGGGGGGWRDVEPLSRPTFPSTWVQPFGAVGGWTGGAGCVAVSGELGDGATAIEVVQGSRAVCRPVEAPIGAFVVCADYGRRFSVRVLDGDGGVLAEFDEPGFDEPETPL